ncbi:MAG: DUF4214 domain-containing protein [Nitrospirae bacterium]|nr:DUF4214 domain-containing protein [Nitrospirota bacterium]
MRNSRFHLFILCIVAILSLGLVANAAATPWPGPDDFGYRGITIPFNWTDISGTGIFVPLSDEAVSGAVPIGFSFSFYGNTYTQVYISSNGFITLSSGQGSGCCSGQAVPNPNNPNNLVAGFWEDLNYPQGGIHYQTIGNRFIVQFTNNPHFANGPQVTFQMILHSGTNNIELQYLNAPTDGGTHTIGIEDIAGTRGLLYFNGSISMANTGLLISTSQVTGHFEFSNISSPQAVGTPFSVTITAKDVYGNVEYYNGYVSVYSNAGSVNPITVWLNSGTWTGNVTLYEGGNGIYLGASAGGKYGTSNTFDVTGGGAGTGNLHGTVKDTDKHLINGAAVNLYRTSPKDGGTPVDTTTAASGYYYFDNISCGKYYIRAEHNGSYSQVHEVTVACGRTEAENLMISYCNADGRLPILLVPGIAGSDSKYNPLIYPILPKDAPEWDSGKLVLHDPFWQAGWDNLKDELATHGYKKDCTMFDVPYDWRLDLNDAWVEYLKPWIDEAKATAGTTEVNIVAHSMGGLLTRTYIESNQYEDDINRFAMVGTPNHGAATAYYMWEGGDPKLADDLNEPFYLEFLNFYMNTFNAMHIVYKKYPLCVKWPVIGWKCDNKEAYEMAHTHVPALKWLMPTFSGVLSKGDITEEENTDLEDLNSDPDTDRMTNDGTGVRTKIFAGDGEKTIRTIYNGNPPQSGDLYPDGVPLSKAPYRPSTGDGTVLKTLSAAVDFLNSPASTNGSHAGLINTFLGDIIVWITGDEPFAPLSPALIHRAQPQALTNLLSLGIDGRIQPYLVSPTGEGSGINPTTGDMENDIADAAVSIGIDAGSISINNPADGTYTVYLKGIYSEDYRLNLGYMDNTETENYSYHGFNHANTISFTITVDSASADKVTVNHTPLPPTGLQADAVDDGGLKTALIWDASADPAVTGYNIYAKYDDEPYLSQIGTSVANSYNTGNAWAENDTIVPSLYAVSAIKADGTESFLSDMVENNDRDHDGLTDAQETSMGTNVSNPDTDGDGLKDGEEYTRGTNPLNADTDGDGSSDYDEVQAGSDPLDKYSPKMHNLVTYYYTSILNRAPEPGGAEGWTSEIQRIDSDGIDIKEGFIALGKLFFNSGEYLSMNTTNSAYVIDLYETFLGRTPTQGEVDAWAGELSGGLTRNLLLNYFIFSAEFRQYMTGIFGDTTVRPEYNLVNDLYRGFLSRLPDNGGFNSWLGEMQTAQCGGDPQAIRDLTSQIALNFLQSQEYANRNTSNSEYIEDLYNGILRRGADLAGYLYWLGALNGGTTRPAMLQLFVDSTEFQARVQQVIDAGCAY